MSAFLTALDVELVDGNACGGRGIWRVMKPFKYYSSLLGQIITVEPGFLSDFASVPRVPIAYLLFGDTSHEESLLHDKLFHSHEICDEQTANKVLLEAAKVAGTPAWRRFGIYLGVVIGGKSSWDEDGRGDGHSIVDGRIV